jgi:urea ABC transporter ATP-binding protein UrtE
MLSIRGLHAGYGESSVLHGVDLDVTAGEVTALLGRNGMGKTTLLKTAMGLLPARRGSVRFGDVEISRWPTHRIARAGLAYVPQGREIFGTFTVAENLRLGFLAHAGLPQHPVAQVLEWFPVLAERSRQRAGTMSGGQQQMLAIARALVGRPKLLLLDEPTEGIQPSIVEEIGDILRRIVKETALTVLLVEQNVDLVARLAQRCAFMDNGAVVESCGIERLHAEPAILHHHLSL